MNICDQLAEFAFCKGSYFRFAQKKSVAIKREDVRCKCFFSFNTDGAAVISSFQKYCILLGYVRQNYWRVSGNDDLNMRFLAANISFYEFQDSVKIYALPLRVKGYFCFIKHYNSIAD